MNKKSKISLSPENINKLENLKNRFKEKIKEAHILENLKSSLSKRHKINQEKLEINSKNKNPLKSYYKTKKEKLELNFKIKDEIEMISIEKLTRYFDFKNTFEKIKNEYEIILFLLEKNEFNSSVFYDKKYVEKIAQKIVDFDLNSISEKKYTKLKKMLKNINQKENPHLNKEFLLLLKWVENSLDYSEYNLTNNKFLVEYEDLRFERDNLIEEEKKIIKVFQTLKKREMKIVIDLKNINLEIREYFASSLENQKEKKIGKRLRMFDVEVVEDKITDIGVQCDFDLQDESQNNIDNSQFNEKLNINEKNYVLRKSLDKYKKFSLFLEKIKNRKNNNLEDNDYYDEKRMSEIEKYMEVFKSDKFLEECYDYSDFGDKLKNNLDDNKKDNLVNIVFSKKKNSLLLENIYNYNSNDNLDSFKDFRKFDKNLKIIKNGNEKKNKFEISKTSNYTFKKKIKKEIGIQTHFSNDLLDTNWNISNNKKLESDNFSKIEFSDSPTEMNYQEDISKINEELSFFDKSENLEEFRSCRIEEILRKKNNYLEKKPNESNKNNSTKKYKQSANLASNYSNKKDLISKNSHKELFFFSKNKNKSKLNLNPFQSKNNKSKSAQIFGKKSYIFVHSVYTKDLYKDFPNSVYYEKLDNQSFWFENNTLKSQKSSHDFFMDNLEKVSFESFCYNR